MISVFLLKQKTAYEMRISDWSSDVCSSDLILMERERERGRRGVGRVAHYKTRGAFCLPRRPGRPYPAETLTFSRTGALPAAVRQPSDHGKPRGARDGQ